MRLENATRPLRVAELFAGVGGFRYGLQAVQNDLTMAPSYTVVWSNQFEPSCKKQDAAEVYRARWGDAGFVNRDIFEVLDDPTAIDELDALDPEMLVGGFPCQDYSVARPAGQSEGLAGKKGVLWWSVARMLNARLAAGKPIQYVLLENVDRLINSPSTCRGRDFSIILASLQSLGYAVEWRIVNAADYGFPQRRKRIFILAYHESTKIYRELSKHRHSEGAGAWLTSHGVLAQALPVVLKRDASVESFVVPADVFSAQAEYVTRSKKGETCFQSAGICIGGEVWTCATQAALINNYSRYVGQDGPMTLGDIVRATTAVPETYFLNSDDLMRWSYLKGAKNEMRIGPNDERYSYCEGAIAFPDSLERSSRTIITSEGGRAASRSKHVICHRDGRMRRLIPEELEALNGFPRGFTNVCKLEAGRAFLMGNALVTGIVTAIGSQLSRRHILSLMLAVA